MWMSAKDHLMLPAVIDQLSELILGLVAGEVKYFIPQLTYSTKPSPTCRLQSLFVNVMSVCYTYTTGMLPFSQWSDERQDYQR